MRLRYLLIWFLVLLPTLSSARRIRVPDPELVGYTIGAAFESGAHAGKLVIAFYNQSGRDSFVLPLRLVDQPFQYPDLTVELTNAHTRRTLRFVVERTRAPLEHVTIEPHGLHFETIDLDDRTADLPPGDYDVTVRWDGHVATTKTFAPYHCGLQAPAYEPPSSSKLPYVLGAFAIAALVGGALLARRGVRAERVPHSFT